MCIAEYLDDAVKEYTNIAMWKYEVEGKAITLQSTEILFIK